MYIWIEPILIFDFFFKICDHTDLKRYLACKYFMLEMISNLFCLFYFFNPRKYFHHESTNKIQFN